MRRAALGLLSLAAGCAIPARDNPADPAVRPSAAIVVLVGGADTGARGGRNDDWTLDGAASEDASEWTWELSRSFADDCSDGGLAWDDAGAGVLVATTSASGVLLRQRLQALPAEAFDGEEGTGVARRWLRLTVEDSGGNRDRACKPVEIVNTAPAVSLGPPRRIAPGGRWWAIDRDDSILSAPPMEVHLEAIAADADPLAVASAEDVEWTVTGELSASLDQDADGLVDGNFVDPANPLRLVFDAPIVPSRSEIGIAIGDIRNASGDIVLNSRTIVAVDVLSSHWVYDAGPNEMIRLDSGGFQSRVMPTAVRILATDGTHTLIASGSGLGVLDPSLREVQRATVGGAGAFFTGGATDGAGGWWVAEGNAGTLRHFTATLTTNASFTNVEGDGAADFGGPHNGYYWRLAPAGGTAVWILGGGGASSSSPRLLKVATTGLVSGVSLPAPGAHAITPDGAGGVWVVSARSPQLQVWHFAADGSLTASETVPTPADPVFTEHEGHAIAYDVVRDRLWIAEKGMNAGNNLFDHRIWRRDPDGSWADLRMPVTRGIALEPNDGTLIVAGDVTGMRRLDATPALADTFSEADFSYDRVVRLVGGSILASHLFGGGILRDRLAFVESGRDSALRILEYVTPAPPTTAADRLAFTVDPLSGSVWVFRPDLSAVEMLSSEGSPIQRVPIAVVGTSAVGALAVDPDRRSLLVAWSTPAAGGLSEIAFEANPEIAHGASPIAGFDLLRDVRDLAVLPGGDLCIAGRSASGAESAWRVDPANPSGGIPLDASGAAVWAVADPAGDVCWFVQEAEPTTLHRVDADGVEETIADGVASPGTATYVRPDVDRRTGRVYFAAGTFQLSPSTVFVQYADSGTPTTAAAVPSMTPPPPAGGPGAWVSEAQSLAIDSYYRTAFVGLGHELKGSFWAGATIRFDLEGPATGQPLAEIQRWGPHVGPRVAGQ